jgi:hypothetical protein
MCRHYSSLLSNSSSLSSACAIASSTSFSNPFFSYSKLPPAAIIFFTALIEALIFSTISLSVLP